jgi:peptide/nickel transport system substrate-binding protein
MPHQPRWLSLATTGLVVAFVFTACSPAAEPTTTPPASQAPSTVPTNPPSNPPSAPTTEQPSASPSQEAMGTPYPEMAAQPGDPSAITDSYPNYGDAIQCGTGTWNNLPYAGNLKSLTAPDPMTVVFTFCNPDVAFLSKIAFSVFSINDSDWLINHIASGDWINTMNGTGPYKIDQWQRGTEIDYSRFDNYWGTPAVAQTAVLKWQPESAARLAELQAGTIDGMTLVGPADFDTVSNDPNLSLDTAAGLNTLYLGMNHDYSPWDNPDVRKALAIGIDRQRIVDNFLPPGSEVATHFTPCQIPFGCNGDDWPAYDPTTAKQMIDSIFGPQGLTTTLSYRPTARGYIPLPAETATDFQAQLEAIDVHVTLDEQDSVTFIQNANTGKLQGLFLLGWGVDYPDITDFLDYHFGAGCTAAFGQCYPDIAEQLTKGNSTADQATRDAAYTQANNLIIQDVPMVPISHAGFANAYLASVGDQQTSPLSNELLFRLVPPSGQTQIVFMQNGEPGSLYCADETDGEALRACEQTMESLYGFKENGTDPIPALATSCDPNADLTVWTCHLRSGVTFQDGSTFEAKDVIVSLAAQWDAALSIHKGVTSTFEYWPGLWGGFLNPPAPCGIEGQPACSE